MKITVFSDSHGSCQPMLAAVAQEEPSLILHLGDYARDCGALAEAFPRIPLRQVRGNGDGLSREPDSDEFMMQGKRVFMTHGHLYGVKLSFAALKKAGLDRAADIILFGHTHAPYYKAEGGVHMINPGAAGRGYKTYAALTIEHGIIRCEIKEL